MRTLIPFVHQLEHSEADEWCQALAEQLPDCDIRQVSQLSTAEKSLVKIAVVANPAPSDLVQLTHLEWVHSVWAGVEGMISNLADMPFEIVRLTDPHLAQTMSEAVLAWVLYLHREMPQYKKQQTDKQWLQQACLSAGERQVAILGLGELGSLSALRLVANGFRVSGWSRSMKTIEGVECYAGDDGLSQVLARSDILVNLLPLTAETKGLMDSRFFNRSKNGASLINFGRGATVVESDLLIALTQGKLAHAVLDVFQQEPLSSESELWVHPDITLLPHISAPTSIRTASQVVSRNISRYLADGSLPQRVDKARGY